MSAGQWKVTGVDYADDGQAVVVTSVFSKSGGVVTMHSLTVTRIPGIGVERRIRQHLEKLP